jgi:Family of unknown function (DUF5691)
MTWPEHVTAALLGTQRRVVPELAGALASGTPGHDSADAGDAAGRLLDQAALLTVRRRAGRTAGTAEPIAPAPAETSEEVSGAAAARLARMLAGQHVRALPEWLQAAAERDRRVPARLLPGLLERGRSDRMLRAHIAKAAGRRGLWLALQNPDWAYLATEDVPAEGPDVWETGTRGQRIAHLGRLRAADPEAARRALRETWAREPAADRVALLATFHEGLSGADEEFLEETLDDRAKDVRAGAADLLSMLPASAYGGRMAGRARDCLRPERRTVRGRAQTWIIAEPPADLDEATRRDGVPFHAAGSFVPGNGGRSGPVGTRAGWLREIVARTPLDTWTGLFGGNPMEVVCLPIADDFARDVHLGWARAAVRQRDAAWARAILKGGVVVEEAEALADLLTVLPDGERDSAAADLARWVKDYPDLLRVLDRIPGPWTGELAEAVLAALAGALTRGAEGMPPHTQQYGLAQLCKLSDERLTPAAAPRLDELTRRHGDNWPLSELTETLRFRHEMLQELL